MSFIIYVLLAGATGYLIGGWVKGRSADSAVAETSADAA